MKILLTGANGQLGRCVQDVIANTDHQLLAVDRAALDISDAESVNAFIEKHRPDTIINAAAYTAVDKAESEPELAALINIQGPANLAAAAEKVGAALIHISTDYVFDGCKADPYTESDATNPKGVYGRTKLAGEQAVKQRCTKHVILRTAWVFSEYGNNFMKTMLRLGGERESLSVVDDQVGCPTYAGDIARACLAVCGAEDEGTAEYGVFHYCGTDIMSWFIFASHIFEQATCNGRVKRAPKLNAITTEQYPTPAVRPRYSVLSNALFHSAYNALPLSTDETIQLCLDRLVDA